ncbi:hypothetical protein [Actinophytocola sp.]|uniref:hypothetical protein n=1 Tax=Actinophytocola sp. TaxID=1872138 RepID=UPI002D3B1212|nr:hypothetical protein [Actinophytocola sp.]HYQ62544.1 hypothetical protein [Actinophytocola sp.]
MTTQTDEQRETLPEMTVTVRDSEAEARRWGSGRGDPVTRKVTISAICPRCGGPRGEPYGHNFCDDGDWSWVQRWNNPCGHVDYYEDVIREAAARLDTIAEQQQTSAAGQWVRRDPHDSQPWETFTHDQMRDLLQAVRDGGRPDVERVESRTPRRVVFKLTAANGGGLATFDWQPAT